MPDDQPTGQIDLESELTCSICTELLYQPLTLLDCLHTFCGACVKEWFLSQASSATSLHPYTCPSCRASVRGTKHNATVSTLLDMFRQAYPNKGRTEADQEDQRKIYKPGDNVLPRLRRRGAAREDDEERRILGEVMARSLEEVGISAGSSDERRERRSRRDRSGRPRSSDPPGEPAEARQVGMYLHNQQEPRGRRRPASRQSSSPTAASARQIEHQSSLRSILSASELAPAEMEEEIMRQIMEDGLLDGIDLSSLDIAQEDEISEMIAQAYRRKQEQRRRERRATREASRRASRHSQRSATAPSGDGHRAPDMRTSGGAIESSGSGAESRTTQRLRASSHSSQHSSNSANAVTSIPLATSVTRRASQSVTDLSSTLITAAPAQRQRRLSHTTRRTTDPAGLRPTGQNDQGQDVTPDSTPRAQPRTGLEATTTSSTTRTRLSPRLAAATFPMDRHSPAPSISSIHTTPPVGAPARPAQPVPSSPPITAPSISCKRCGTKHIEYDLHYNCGKCNSGNYNLCLRCYQQGKGCLHWYGFGWGAWAKYDRAKPAGGYPVDHEPPHTLTGHRYNRPPPKNDALTAEGLPQVSSSTSEGQSNRLESGVFCDICHALANDWYWRCEACNDGEWGHCNSCINRGRHCTHPLQPVRYQETFGTAPGDLRNSQGTSQVPAVSSSPSSTEPGPSISSAVATTPIKTFTPLSPSTSCDICKYPIPPSTTRFHCPQCNGGDYDICTPCYMGLVKSGRITQENGHQGWRRCPQGHRMVIVGSEDRDGGQKRIVVRDLVGGIALREDDGTQHVTDVTPRQNNPGSPPSSPNHSATWSWRDEDGTLRNAHWKVGGNGGMPSGPGHHFPPDGGVGLRILAHWSYYPADGVMDELMFPRGAEIREAEDINGDWYWGVYAGAKGLFPGNYGRVVGRT